MSPSFFKVSYVVPAQFFISTLLRRAISASLPSPLSNAVPTCARSCLEAFIEQAFPPSTCSESADLDCLCSHYGATGYTLGEGTFSCVYSACPAGTLPDAGSLYNICLGRNQTVLPTHGILTVTVVPTGTATTALHASNTSSLQTTKPVLSVANILLTVPDSPPKLPQTATASAQNIAAGAANANRLTTVQIVGIAVAGIGSIMFAFGMAVCLACVKRRRLHKDQREAKSDRLSLDFADETPVYGSRFPFGGEVRDPRGGTVGVRVASVRITHPSEAKQRPYTFIGIVKPVDIKVVSGLEEEHAHPPGTVANACRVSESPLDKIQVRDGTAALSARPESAWTQNTVFEEDHSVVQSPYAANTASQPTRPPRLSQIGDRHRPLSTVTSIHSSRVTPRPPPLCLKIPTYPQRREVGLLGGVCEARRRPDAANDSRDSFTLVPRRAPPSVLSGGTVSSTDDLINSYSNPGEPHQVQQAKASPTSIAVVTSTVSEAKQSRDSCNSDTSFESANPDEPTPPEEEIIRLSVMAESPISSLSYPKVPRPSNQAVPRSPGSSQGTKSERSLEDLASSTSPVKLQSTGQYPTTLLGKRRGDRAAQDIERRLWITGSNFNDVRSSTSSANRAPSEAARLSKGHSLAASHDAVGRNLPLTPRRDRLCDTWHTSQRVSHSDLGVQWVTAATPPMQMVIRSPIWAPTITPTRRGDDLFLSVA